MKRFFSEENNQKKKLPPILKQETMELLWNPVMKCHKDRDSFSGLGWMVNEEKDGQAFGKVNRFYAAHTGGAVGASSVLLIYPRKKEILTKNPDTIQIPQGVVVAIICNIPNVPYQLFPSKIYRNPPIISFVLRESGPWYTQKFVHCT